MERFVVSPQHHRHGNGCGCDVGSVDVKSHPQTQRHIHNHSLSMTLLWAACEITSTDPTSHPQSFPIRHTTVGCMWNHIHRPNVPSTIIPYPSHYCGLHVKSHPQTQRHIHNHSLSVTLLWAACEITSTDPTSHPQSFPIRHTTVGCMWNHIHRPNVTSTIIPYPWHYCGLHVKSHPQTQLHIHRQNVTSTDTSYPHPQSFPIRDTTVG